MATSPYSFLGSSGVKVSKICLGTASFGKHHRERPGLNEPDSHRVLDKFIELGGNFIDSADWYGAGEAENIVGRWLSKRLSNRDDYVIASKVYLPMGTGPNQVGLSRKHIVHSIESSLKRLGTDFIDLYQMHMWDSATSIEQTLRTMNDLIRKGLIRQIGVSNFTGWQLQKICDYARFMGIDEAVSIQSQYNLLTRGLEYEVTDICQNENVSILAFSPLKGGWLNCRIKRGQPPPTDSRVAWVEQDPSTRRDMSSVPHTGLADKEITWRVLDTIQDIANTKGKTPAQISSRWILQRPKVSSIIIGPSKLEHLTDLWDVSCGWELTDNEMKRLNEASDPEIPYPYDITRAIKNQRLGTEKSNY